MLIFNFSYDNEAIATIHNLSKLSNKKIWKMLEEAITIHAKGNLLSELNPIRERLEKETVIIDYNFDSKKNEFDISYQANNDLANLI
jgi:hypothetical protein